MVNQTENFKVLILDDELGMCLGAQRVLKNYITLIDELETDVSFDTQYVNSITDFKKIFQEQDFDIIILDYKLPEGSGLDVLPMIKSKRSEIIVIMITAYATFETAVQATKGGAYDFLPKPFTPDELRYTIKKAAAQYLLAKHAKKFEEEKRKIRFQFISVLSHELKSPINAVEGYINILKKNRNSLGEEDYEMMLNRSLLRLDGMRKLIYDLLDLTRIESGEKKRDLRDLDIIHILNSCLELLELEAKKRNITIEKEIPEELQFYGDINEIEIILNNLISNSIKYNKDNGQVKISLYDTPEQLVISVADSGIGLTSEESEKLFRDFVRIKNDDTANIMGSGLGLSTVRKIAQLYQGTATVVSKKNEGSTFTVQLKRNNPKD
ncbi:MAG: ATP-binding protein [Spirochaetes bacterium]|nr:ATP-binding protein [Spirochaetota bacterium]